MTPSLAFGTTPLAGLMTVRREPAVDQRGFFERLFFAEQCAAIGLLKPIVQINHSLTRDRGTVRGMHFQHPPYAEAKLVTCLRGEVFDVAVDIRRGSPTFLHWHGEVLSESNHASLYIPEGFAHGFQALTENCELLYLHTAAYAARAEGALHVQDPAIRIAWPLPITDISERDRTHPTLESSFAGIVLA